MYKTEKKVWLKFKFTKRRAPVHGFRYCFNVLLECDFIVCDKAQCKNQIKTTNFYKEMIKTYA